MADERGATDRKILKLAAEGKSPEAISAALGHVISPPQVAVRVHYLVESADEYLSIPQQIRLNLQAMRSVLGEIQDQYLTDDNAKIRLSYFQAIAKHLETLQKTNDQDLSVYSENVGRAMVAAYDIALAHIGGRIADRVPVEEFTALKREALEVAQGEVARRQIESW